MWLDTNQATNYARIANLGMAGPFMFSGADLPSPIWSG